MHSSIIRLENGYKEKICVTKLTELTNQTADIRKKKTKMKKKKENGLIRTRSANILNGIDT